MLLVLAIAGIASLPASAAPASGTPATAAATGAGSPYAVRGMYERDFSPSGFDHQAALGFNYIDSGPYEDQMDALAARGLKGFIYLGGYSNETCTFRRSDAWVRSHVAPIAGHPGVGAYFIDDEPNAAACPRAPAQMKARSDLVKSIDPRPPTFIVIYRIEQFKLFAGVTDIIGLDRYPCKVRLAGCDYSVIDEQAAEADRLGIRYWGVIQAWGDGWYKLPTPEELHQQFVHWRATNMEGYLVFAWNYPDDMPEMWLANHPELQRQLAVENGAAGSDENGSTGSSPPDTRITARPRGETTSRRAVFRFRSSASGASFRCKLDRRPWAGCTSPKVYRRLSRGVHTFRVRARDSLGRVDPTPAVRRWRVR